MVTMEYVPGLAGIPAAESSISFVDGEIGLLEYRGIAIQALAEHSTFEETAFLLLDGKLPARAELDAFSARLRGHRALDAEMIRILRALPAKGHPMNALQAAVSALGMIHPAREVESPAVRRETAERLIGQMATLTAAVYRMQHGKDPMAPREDLSHAGNFLYMTRGEVPDALETRVFDAALVLHADHTMNASTFTARVIGSTLSDGYSVVSGALGSLFGPLHGGANEAVLNMLDRMATVENVRRTAEDLIDRKQKIMGVGHRVYKVKDPRAYILQGLAEQVFAAKGASPRYALAKELEAVVEERLGPKKIYANVDFYSGILYDALGISRELFTPIFAVSRVSGWTAHWLEQLENNRLFRPRQVYQGGHRVPYVPVEQRG